MAIRISDVVNEYGTIIEVIDSKFAQRWYNQAVRKQVNGLSNKKRSSEATLTHLSIWHQAVEGCQGGFIVH